MRAIKTLALCLTAVGMGSCGLVDTDAREANDRVMLVRENPPSFGYQRLIHHERRFPEVGKFVQLAGRPDFLAEMSNQDRRYLILYYLKIRHAYACRTGLGYRGEVEFAGPYPITDGEYEKLTGFRTQSQKAHAVQSFKKEQPNW
jgi:hypothetical protein